MHVLLIVVLVLLLQTGAATAAPQDATTIVHNMYAALEPVRPSLQKLTISSRDANGEERQLVAYQAHKRINHEDRRLLVLQAPEDLKGISYLIREQTGKPDLQWEYLPAVRRVREVTPTGAAQRFLGTMFTYGDLGLAKLRDRTCRFLGMEKHVGVWAYKLEETPRQPWYYSRVITWIATDSFLPLERLYYAPSGELWRIERFAEIKDIDGVPTPLWISMENRQTGSRSTINVSTVRYDADLPDALFDPDRLPEAVHSQVWQNASIIQNTQIAPQRGPSRE